MTGRIRIYANFGICQGVVGLSVVCIPDTIERRCTAWRRSPMHRCTGYQSFCAMGNHMDWGRISSGTGLGEQQFRKALKNQVSELFTVGDSPVWHCGPLTQHATGESGGRPDVN